MQRMSKYLEFKQVSYNGKTKRFKVISKNHGDVLGKISWYGAWKQYVFSPAFETVWNRDCLKDIQDFIQELMNERKHLKFVQLDILDQRPEWKK